MKTSRTGAHLIADFEGFPNRGRPYNDPVGLATVGYGHLIARRRVNDADRHARWLPDQARPGVLTQAEAERLLLHDLTRFEDAVHRQVHVPLSQNEFDALVSLVYNIGEGNFANSTVLRRLNAGDRHGAAEAFLMWTKAGDPPRPLDGLVRRRSTERALFLMHAPKPPLKGYTVGESAWIREYDALMRDPDRRRTAARRAALRGMMRDQRKRIWRAAQQTGWNRANRRARYHSLLVRSR